MREKIWISVCGAGALESHRARFPVRREIDLLCGNRSTARCEPLLRHYRVTDESAIKCRRRERLLARSTNGSDESLRLLCLQFRALVLSHVVLGHFPSLVGIVLIHGLERF
jgi:hypothetical protein